MRIVPLHVYLLLLVWEINMFREYKGKVGHDKYVTEERNT